MSPCSAHAHLLGAAKRAAVETGDLALVEALFVQAVAVAKHEDNVTLTLDPHAEAIRYTAPVLASRANVAALACNVAEAIALYRQVRELAPHFFPGDPQVIVPVLAEQNGCSPSAVTGTATAEPASEQPPSPLPSPTVTPRVTGTPVASTSVATPGRLVTPTPSSP